MHGRVKTRSTEEQQKLKNIERAKKLHLYMAGISKAFEKRKNGEYDDEALEITGQLLSANPDIYSLWNFRREILLNSIDTSLPGFNDEFQSKMEGELQLTLKCLQVNPKSYGGWHHRVWVLDNMPTPNWAQELSLCSKYLEMDERNFHVWDHRRFVVKKSVVPSTEELAFSSAKIAVNFSNYSSWHYRSSLLPSIYPDPERKRPIREGEHKEELELVQNACFTDPNDQSAWFYQRWLLGRSTQPLNFSQVVISPDSICITFTQNVRLFYEGLDVVFLNDGQYVEGVWASSKGVQSHVWGFYPNADLQHGDNERYPCVVTLLKNGQEIDSMTIEVVNGKGLMLRKAEFGAGFSKGLTSVLEEQLDSCLQLLEMEPDSKWTLLTSVLLMQAIDRHKYKEETMCTINRLLKIDALRSGYYNDLRSRFVMEYAINTLDERMSDKEIQREVNLSGLNLTSLYHGHHLSFLVKVDLSHNQLFRSLHQLHQLQSCTWLCLDDNAIENLEDMPELPALTTLLLRGNKIPSIEALCNIERCQSIATLDLTGNLLLLQHNSLLKTKMQEMFPALAIFNEQIL